MLALAVVWILFFASCSGVSPQGKIYEFDSGNAESMREYFELRKWQFFKGIPDAAIKIAVKACGKNPLVLGAAIHGESYAMRGMCVRTDMPMPTKVRAVMCAELGKDLGLELSLLHSAGPIFYCGEPGQEVAGA